MNLLIPLPYVALMLVTFGLLCYAIGASHISNWLMGDHQRVDAAVRLLYSTLGYVYDEPTERPNLWRRLSDRMEPTVESDAAEEAAEEPHRDQRSRTVAHAAVEGDPHRAPGAAESSYTEAEEDEPEFTPDPNPSTAPIVMPDPTGPATVPSAAVIDADWEQRSQQMLAEARAAIAEIGGGGR